LVDDVVENPVYPFLALSFSFADATASQAPRPAGKSGGQGENRCPGPQQKSHSIHLKRQELQYGAGCEAHGQTDAKAGRYLVLQLIARSVPEGCIRPRIR
jgi:hypothetical protein